jgi:hypothetical protein
VTHGAHLTAISNEVLVFYWYSDARPALNGCGKCHCLYACMSYEEEDTCLLVSATVCLNRKRPLLAWLSMEDGDGGGGWRRWDGAWVAQVGIANVLLMCC